MGEKCKQLFLRHGWQVFSESVVSGACYMNFGNEHLIYINPDGRVEVLVGPEG